ncbi:CBS domain-containing protein [Balneatrix alpica]|uniref:CBS domain-containing protein n=1 Tax=Balneatrix alpica TaxID=75684 RepID=UPI002739E08B|nr:CBS domain-containing protein [Balneatrix alpica]
MLKSVKVSDYMTSDPVTFTEDTDLFEAINILLTHRISGAPVVNKAGDLIGLLSEVDCLRGILNDTYHETELGGCVGDFMARNIQSVAADADILEICKIFINQGRRRLPVVRGTRLVGQISRRDVLRAIRDFANMG